MKKAILFGNLLLICSLLRAQSEPQYSVEATYYQGSILPHSKQILHLITDHPEGFMFTVNKKHFGNKEWESRFNYPDIGLTFHYQNNKNESLGDMYGLFAHFNFYFLKRNLMLRVAQGVAYNTHPYDKVDNPLNLAFSTKLMPATFFMINYTKPNIYEGFGINVGGFLLHHSNGTMKSPNTSTNTVAANIGLTYTFDHKNERIYLFKNQVDSTFSEPIRYNFALRSGVQASRTVGLGEFPFYTFSGFVDKRISRSSAFQLGADLFISPMLKEEIAFKSVSFPELNINPKTSSTRVGAFVGYELFINRLSVEGQMGFYILDEYKNNTSVYQRLGLKYYFTNHFFFSTGLKTHFSKAETMEFSLGARF